MNGTEVYRQKWIDMAHAVFNKNPDMPFLEDFFISISNNLELSTSYKYLTDVERFMRTIGKKDPTCLSLIDYDRFLNSISNQTQSAKIGVYHSIKKFSKFIKKYKIGEDFMEEAERPKFKESAETKEKREKGYLTKKEVRILINTIKNSDRPDIWKQRDLTIVMIFLTSGIRRAALYKLDISDINLEENTLNASEKGGATRIVYLPEKTITEIKKWLEYRNRIVTDDNALFISCQHHRLDRGQIYLIIKKYAAGIKGKNIAPHKLRATYGTETFNKSNDVYFVQKLMGHKSPQTTELYIRGKGKDIAKKGVEIMNNFIDGAL